MSFSRLHAAAVTMLVVFSGSALAQDSTPETQESAPVSPPATSDYSLVPYVTAGISMGQPYDDTTTGGFATDMGMQLGTSLGVGVRMGPVMVEARYEEHTFFLNNLNPIAPSTLPVTDYKGDVDVYALTGQVAVEFAETGFIRPYAGLAGGVAGISADYMENYCGGCTPGLRFVSESDYALVWSGTVGLAIDAGAAGEYYIGYRHFRTNNFNLSTTGGAAFQQKGLRSDNIELGIRFNFN